MALAGWFDRDEGFNVLFRFGITAAVPLLGDVLPLSRLPPGLRELAYTTPLWHGST